MAGAPHHGLVPNRPDPEQLPVFDERFVAAARYHEAPADVRIATAQLQAREAPETGSPGQSPGPYRLPVRSGPHALPDTPTRRRPSLAGPGLALLAALVIGVWQPGIDTHRPTAAPPSDARVVATSDAPPVTAPTAAPATRRLLPTPARPALGGSYAFLAGSAAEPVTWDPCRSIGYVVRTAGQPDGGAALLAGAMAELSARTGLRFVRQGEVTEDASVDRPAYQRERYGQRWAPVLLVWSAHHGSTDLTSYGPHYVSGQVVLSAAAGADGVRHQLGHLAGLDHVADPGELMSPARQGSGYGPGDIAGMARAGGGRCG